MPLIQGVSSLRKSTRVKKPIERFQCASSSVVRKKNKRKNQKNPKKVVLTTPISKKKKKGTQQGRRKNAGPTSCYYRTFQDQVDASNAREKRLADRVARRERRKANVRLSSARHHPLARLSQRRSLTREIIERKGLLGRNSAPPTRMQSLLKTIRMRRQMRAKLIRPSRIRESAARRFDQTNPRRMAPSFRLPNQDRQPDRDDPVFAVPALPSEDDKFQKKILKTLGINKNQKFSGAVTALALYSKTNWIWLDRDGSIDVGAWLKSNKNTSALLKILFLEVDDRKFRSFYNTTLGNVFWRNLLSTAKFDYGEGLIDNDWFREAAKIILVSLIPEKYQTEMEQWRSIVAFFLMNDTNCSVAEDYDRKNAVKLIERFSGPPGTENEMTELGHVYFKYSNVPSSGDDLRRKYNDLFDRLKNEQSSEEMFKIFSEASEGVCPVAKDVMRGMMLLARARVHKGST